MPDCQITHAGHPVQTLDEKERILNEAVDNKWYFFLEHDAREEVITVGKEDGKFSVKDRLLLGDL